MRLRGRAIGVRVFYDARRSRGFMNDERERELFECAACRAHRFAGNCGDDTLADALRVFAPHHTCGKDGAPRGQARESGARESGARERGTDESGEDDGERETRRAIKAVDLVAFNGMAEERFLVFLEALLCVEGALLVLDAIRESAFELDISTETAKRYLLKHSARRARFVVEGGRVRLR